MLLELHSRKKTAFITPFGLFEYERVPFGLKNAPPHFMQCIDAMMQEHDVEGSKGFVDDLLTGGVNIEQYLERLRKLLHALRQNQWLISPSKARFGYTKIAVLGHIVEAGRIRPDMEKVECIGRLKAPETVKHVRAFLGLVGFYRKFIPRFAKLAKPLINLTKGDEEWYWG